jgi:hypothetical protein
MGDHETPTTMVDDPHTSPPIFNPQQSSSTVITLAPRIMKHH